MTRQLQFFLDPDSDGYSVDICSEPDERGSFLVIGRIDLFGMTVNFDGRHPLPIPAQLRSSEGIEAWIKELT